MASAAIHPDNRPLRIASPLPTGDSSYLCSSTQWGSATVLMDAEAGAPGLTRPPGRTPPRTTAGRVGLG